jgi:hypothetical protein
VKTRTLKLITQYDATLNAYTVFHHNLTGEEAQEKLRDLSARMFSLFLIDQHGIHHVEDPDHCEACRREVERTSRLKPQPTFKRRKQ